MKKFRFWNNLIGWIVFGIAALTYLLTLEPTASLWDCGEFISSAYKLQVGHPPGAPLFMLMARFFSLFAGGDVTRVAVMINALSGLASAFTILFLFWTISYLARKIIAPDGLFTTGRLIAIFGSAAVGSLAYTFSDSFWFSAVEAEVYATSSLFTAVVFWAMLKWENVADEKHANRWLIFIAYLMGLSIGVHLLNLLTIPALVLIYYFRKYQPTTKGFIYALLIGMVILGAMMYGVISGVIKVASWFELAFVNGFGLPFNSGVIFYAALLVSLIIIGIRYTIHHRKVLLNTIILCFTVALIGYSSYATIVIRALADPPMDENSPDNVFALLSYLNREQYGDRPLFKGQYYSAPIIDVAEGDNEYAQLNGKYVVIYKKPKYVFAPELTGFFPRMWSNDPSHIRVYQDWGKVKGKPVRITGRDGKTQTYIRPTFAENLRFFIGYQLGYMYFRYFMWNFSGRQNDNQGDGGITNGNWITGIDAIDSMMLGDQASLPEYRKNIPSRNTYYMLPLLLGIIGLLYQLQREKDEKASAFSRRRKDFWVVFTLFFMTGIAIVIYLNQTPLQPRERDYSYVGSFYAFSIWIGLGVAAIWEVLGRKRETLKAILVTALCLLLVPGIMAKENWDDHDRSGRYTTRDLAANYLKTCAPGAILFTNGDNDTFPLWYCQEVEGIRTDVRVCNLMLLNMDWYIDQMKRKAYESDPLPLSMTRDKYVSGRRNQIYLLDRIKEPITVEDAVKFVLSDDPRTKTIPNYPELVDHIPGKNFRIPVDTSVVLANGTVKRKDASLIEPFVPWNISRNSISKSEFAVMDLFATNKWHRPVYFASVGTEGSFGLNDYTQLEGFAWRFVPIKTPDRNFFTYGRIDTDILYDNLMNKFHWGRMNAPDVYLDFFTVRTIAIVRMRSQFNRLAEALLQEGKKDSALNVLDRIMELTPNSKVPYDYFTPGTIEGYYKAGATARANQILDEFAEILDKDLSYFFGLKKKFTERASIEIQECLQNLQQLMILARTYNQNEKASKLEQNFTFYYQQFQNL